MRLCKLFIAVFLFITLLFGCSVAQDQAKTGTIVAMEDERILVISEATEDDIADLSLQEMIDKYEDGTWFTVNPIDLKQDLEIGMTAKVWYDTLDTSLPASGEAERIEIQ